MLFRLLQISLVFITLSNCSTGPDNSRINNNDPESKSYLPDLNQISSEIYSNKEVLVSWRDQSDFEDGFIISKSLGDDESFIPIDTLPPNTTSYTDTSKELDSRTYYKVTTFSNNSGSVNGKSLSVAVDFGVFSDINVQVSNGNELTIEWNDSELYAEKVLIEKLNKGAARWVKIDSIDVSANSFTYMDDDDVYKLQLRLSAKILNYKGESQKVHSKKSDTVYFNIPSNFDVELLNEAQIRISFNDITDFDDQFIIYERYRVGWHNSYSDFIPIDTIDSGGNIFISQLENFDRAYAIGGIFENELSGKSKPVEVSLHSNPPKLMDNVLSSVSPTSVKITWQDDNSLETTGIETYHYELFLFSAETGDLIQKVVLLPTQTEYTIDNLNPEVEYEFSLRTYNSRKLKPIAFSVKPSLKKVSDIEIDSYDEDFKSAKILPDHELFVFSPYQRGLAGLKVFDLHTNTAQTLNDTGNDQSEYENKFIEDFSFYENLDLIATKRSREIDTEGDIKRFLYVADRTSGTPEYFKKEVSLYDYDDQIHLIGFLSNSELLYIYRERYSDYEFRVYKWNFSTNETEIIYSNTPYSTSYIDKEEKKIIIVSFRKLSVINFDGTVINEIENSDFTFNTEITASSLPNSLFIKTDNALYKFNQSTNSITKHSEIDLFHDFFEVPEQNLIISYRRNYLVYINYESGTHIYSVYDPEETLMFYDGAYLKNKNLFYFQTNEGIDVYELKHEWVTTNFNCC